MKQKLNYILLIVTVLFINTITIQAQATDWVYMHEGNRHFKKGDYTNAEISYRKALKENPSNGRALFNLGDTYLALNNPQDAMKMYQEAANSEENKIFKAMSYHNMGYIYHKNNQYKEAIDYYKEALRNNPKDNETRYNLALCQKQQTEQDSTKNKQQNESHQNKQEQPKETENNKSDSDKEKVKDKNEISEDNAQQLLHLARRAEQQTREKLNKQQLQPVRKIYNKNW